MSSNENDHSELKFTPTPSNIHKNEGASYEIVFLATVVLRLVLDNKISNFKISCNDGAYGKIDDVVIRTESNGAKDFFAMQLKYSSKPTSKTVKINDLTNILGDFSILQYFTSWKKIKQRMEDNFNNFKWILFTNREVKINEDSSIIVNDTNVQIQNVKPNKLFKKFFQELKVIGFLVTKEENKSRRTRRRKKEKIDKDFLDNFFIYKHQQNVDQMKEELLEIIKKIHGNIKTFRNFWDFLQNWCKKGDEKHYLIKSQMQQVLALCLSSSNIQRINFCGEENSRKAHTLFKALDKFDVIYLKTYPRHFVWNINQLEADIKKLETDGDLKEIIPIGTKRIGECSLDDEHQMDSWIKLWRTNKCPLILKYTTPEDFEKFKIIIDILCKNKKFVVILSNVDTTKLNENFKIFRHLGDLEEYTIYEELLNMYECSIQRKNNNVTLKELIDSNKDLQECFTTEELFLYLNDTLNIGGEPEEIPDPYMKRRLFTNDASNGEEEDKFYEKVNSSKTEESNVIIICDKPGTGKSSLIKQFKNNTFPTRWTVLIHLNADYTYFSKNLNEDKFTEDLEKKVKDKFSENDFNYKVFKIMLKNNNVNCIWDGLDKTSFEYVTTIIKRYSEISHCLTARNNLQQDLKEEFPNTCIRQLKISDEQKMIGYIEEQLKPKNNYEAFKKYLNAEILGIPRQAKMLKEFFEHQKEPLLISHLYKYLIDHTFSIYFKEDENVNNENHILRERNQQYKNNRIKMYGLLAFIKQFPTYKLSIDIENSLNNFLVALKDQNDCVGIITSISNDNSPNFIHQMYENYFAALYIVKNKIPVDKQSEEYQLLSTLIEQMEADLKKKNSGAVAE